MKARVQKPVCGKCSAPLDLHGFVSDVSQNALAKIIKAAETVVVDFWAEWCGPCRAYAPVYEKVSLERTDAVFLKVNTEVEAKLSAAFNVRGIPCTILFRNGVEVHRQPGAMSEEQLKNFLNEVRN